MFRDTKSAGSRRAALILLSAFLISSIMPACAAPGNPMTTPPPYRLTVSEQAPSATPSPSPSPSATLSPVETPIAAAVRSTAAPDLIVPTPDPADYAAQEQEDVELTEEMLAELDASVRDLLDTEGFEDLDSVNGVTNILLVGLDARPKETKSRSDTMMILTLDSRRDKIKLISLMRDMYVKIPGHKNNRLNAAWLYGGADLLMDTIQENFGIQIDDYVAIDLTMMIEVVDQLGGLTLTVPNKTHMNAINGVIYAYNYQFGEPEEDGLLTKTGEQWMNGKQVQAYARYRKADSDFKRTQRQREVIAKLFEKLSGMSVLDLTLLASSVMPGVETSLSLTDIVSLIPLMMRMSGIQVQETRLPGDNEYEARMVSGMSVLVPDLAACRKSLKSFLSD